MTESEILRISERLCERGLLKCTRIEGGKPIYEPTVAGWLAVMRLQTVDN